MRVWILRIGISSGVLLLLAALGLWLGLRSSLPMLEGELALAGLDAEVRLERDALGTLTVHAATAADAARALGFAHAQERFFEMDLARRSAAGELAELLGPAALARDRANRVHRFRARMPDYLNALDEEQRALLKAYGEGVNAGLAQLGARPPAYLLLRTPPRAWREEDSLLVGLSMFFELQDAQNRRELGFLQLARHLPLELQQALMAPGTEWDAPLQGPAWAALDRERLIAALPATLPATAHLDLRPSVDDPDLPGSNNFAVDGRLTADGRALLADDMHLGLRAPGTWFRARLIYRDPLAPGGQVDASGASLPGVPGLLVGSTGHIAWGFTNSYGDWLDWVAVDFIDPEKTRYRTPAGDAEVVVLQESIKIKGAADDILEIRQTRWGPLLAATPDGQGLALRWTAHRPGSVDLGLLQLLQAPDIEAAIAIAQRSGTPVQNVLFADRQGRIAWTLMGRLPERLGKCDPKLALQPSRGCDWSPRWLEAERVPRLVDPADGRLWTANSRVVDADGLRVVGDGGYDFGARQRQIRDVLQNRSEFAEKDLLALQLDDRALFLQPWWRRLREVLAAADSQPLLLELERVTRQAPERASVESVSYRAARGYRALLLEQVMNALLAPVKQAEGDAYIAPRASQFEPVLLALLETQPSALLPEGVASFAALQQSAAQSLAEEWRAQGEDFSLRSWGERNSSRICQPLASALPRIFETWLCMPSAPLPGDSNMPRVQGPSFGASQRMVVSPGREVDGIFHMPGGQSGHPLSPFWGAGHAAWESGEISPFLPGAAQHRLRLIPAALRAPGT